MFNGPFTVYALAILSYQGNFKGCIRDKTSQNVEKLRDTTSQNSHTSLPNCFHLYSLEEHRIGHILSAHRLEPHPSQIVP